MRSKRAPMPDDLKEKMADKMGVSISHLIGELSGVRTGRASLGLFDSVKVNYYGTPTPLNQVASLSIPESRCVAVQPWDVSQLQEIEKAIMSSGLGLTPSNDGKVIRIPIPALTEDRRKELVKFVKRIGEDCKIAIRNVRRDTNDELKSQQKEGIITEDEERKNQEAVQKITDQSIAKVDDILRKKEIEILEV
ncbi:MAG: ribosome recycling factor [Nitrospiria bacterium]